MFSSRTLRFAAAGFAAGAAWGSARAEEHKQLRPSDFLLGGYGPSRQTEMLLFSGGTAMNGLARALSSLSLRVAHVLPVSDDGGSTAEIVRVLGGPAVGDIRSRCLRLSDISTPEARAVKSLLQHRLPRDPDSAREAWHRIVEGKHPLWEGIEGPYKATIRA
eukprot:Hpha_TRINITY_DN2907_c0_g1::TRINITY_DN2907_c0_g1_i1::g.19581::m.19581